MRYPELRLLLDPDYRERIINLGLAVTFDTHNH
jgi:hypothetical protein